jgi:hypothetical protein
MVMLKLVWYYLLIKQPLTLDISMGARQSIG